jgi:hypothetical protein
MNSVTTVALSGVIGAPNSQFDWRWLPQRNCERCLALSESAGARNSRAYCPGDSPHSPYGSRVSIGGDNSSRREIHSRCESNGSYVHAALCLLYQAGNRRSIPKIDVSEGDESAGHLDFEGQYTGHRISGSVAHHELLRQEDYASTFGIHGTTGCDELANGREHCGVFANLGRIKLW